MAIRIFSGAIGLFYVGETIQYMAENDITYVCSVGNNVVEGDMDDWIAGMQPFADAGVKVRLDLEVPFSYYDGELISSSLTTDNYDSIYGDSIRLLEKEGSWFDGYDYESGYDAAAEWLRGRTNRTITDYLFTYWAQPGWDPALNNTYPAPDPADVTPTPPAWFAFPECSDLNTRLEWVDEVLLQVFWLTEASYAIRAGEWIQANSPDIPLGIISVINPDAICWGYYYYGGAQLSAAEQQQRATTEILKIKNALGPLIMQMMIADPIGSGMPIIDQAKFWQSLHYDSKNVYDMSQLGIQPRYSGASACTHEMVKPPDTFANTGKELILLKDNGTASTHDIVVTSSLDPLTHKHYSLPLSQDRGTFIGPYPLDTYGALPTIEYDNTNLYISILKVEASA